MRALVAMALVALVMAGCGEPGEKTPLAQGKTVYADVCSVCHGPTGDGGVGPALDAVVITWPSCRDHIDWIELGSEGWMSTRGDTYGATEKPVKGGMPGQAGHLDSSQIAAAALFERVTYGGVDEASAQADCGLDATTGGG